MMTPLIRPIAPADNEALALIIRNSLAEFGANRPGTVYFDPTTDHLYELFRQPGSMYLVAEENSEVLGGAGIYPSPGLPNQTCELVKMYLRPSARGRGLGAELIGRCLEAARQMDYRQVYIESMPELKKAIGIYESFGFRRLEQPMGNTGHTGCSVWMLLGL